MKLRRPSIASRVRTLTWRPRKRRKCSGLVSGRSAPGDETSSEYDSSRSRSWLGHPLAQREIDPVRVVDVQAQRLRGGLFERDQLDVRSNAAIRSSIVF